MTKRERVYLESVLEQLKTEQRLDICDLKGSTKAYARYSIGKITKAAEVIDMLEDILGGKEDV